MAVTISALILVLALVVGSNADRGFKSLISVPLYTNGPILSNMPMTLWESSSHSSSAASVFVNTVNDILDHEGLFTRMFQMPHTFEDVVQSHFNTAFSTGVDLGMTEPLYFATNSSNRIETTLPSLNIPYYLHVGLHSVAQMLEQKNVLNDQNALKIGQQYAKALTSGPHSTAAASTFRDLYDATAQNALEFFKQFNVYDAATIQSLSGTYGSELLQVLSQ